MRLLSREGPAAGSALLAIDRRQARDYEQVMAAAGRPPAGWNPAGEHGAPVGWDLVLVAPRTLSVLLYELIGQALTEAKREGGGVERASALLDDHQQLAGAHHQAVELVVRQFAEQTHLASAWQTGRPWQTCHPLDSARQALLHTHTIFGALTEGGRRRGELLRLVGTSRGGRRRRAAGPASRAAGRARPGAPAVVGDRCLRPRGRGPVGMLSRVGGG